MVSWTTAGGAVVGNARDQVNSARYWWRNSATGRGGRPVNLLKGAGGVVVLPGQDRPLARDEQLNGPRRYPAAGQAVEVLPLGRDAEGDGFAEFDREKFERLGPGQRDRPGQVVMRAPQPGVCEHAEPGRGHVAVVDQRHPTGVGHAGPGAGGTHLAGRASSDAEKIAGRIVEYGKAAEAANWSMLWWAR